MYIAVLLTSTFKLYTTGDDVVLSIILGSHVKLKRRVDACKRVYRRVQMRLRLKMMIKRVQSRFRDAFRRVLTNNCVQTHLIYERVLFFLPLKTRLDAF